MWLKTKNQFGNTWITFATCSCYMRSTSGSSSSWVVGLLSNGMLLENFYVRGYQNKSAPGSICEMGTASCDFLEVHKSRTLQKVRNCIL